MIVERFIRRNGAVGDISLTTKHIGCSPHITHSQTITKMLISVGHSSSDRHVKQVASASPTALPSGLQTPRTSVAHAPRTMGKLSSRRSKESTGRSIHMR